MKRLVLLLLLVTVTTVAIGQRFYRNTLFISHQPGDLGLGVRYDRHYKHWSPYGCISFGAYHGVHGDWIVKNHIRVSGGGSIDIYKDRRFSNFLTMGVGYHHYGNLINRWDPLITMPVNEATSYIFFPLSLETGFGITIRRFQMCARLDVIKFEMALDFGLKF